MLIFRVRVDRPEINKADQVADLRNEKLREEIAY